MALFVLAPTLALEAQQPSRGTNQVELQQNYPNPFNPATTIPFRLSADLWASGHRPIVSLRIYNVLAQLVAIPSLQQSGQPLDNVELDCNNPSNGFCDFSAYWDGFYMSTTREAASGVYVYQLVVNGQRSSRRMIVMK
ncbi:MAG: hypothetical protein ACHQU8_06675 [Gemmatimonadales bacterium]